MDRDGEKDCTSCGEIMEYISCSCTKEIGYSNSLGLVVIIHTGNLVSHFCFDYSFVYLAECLLWSQYSLMISTAFALILKFIIIFQN